jgi:arsenate reductase
MAIFQKLETLLLNLSTETISEERKLVLQPFAAYLQEKANNNEPILMNFICTHNSRRSHLSQVWAQTCAAFYQISHVFSYSGGTEATALFPQVAKTLQAQGFEILMLSEANNPVYAIKYAENEHPVIGFSKTYDHAFNPAQNFVALMTCTSADQGCPFVAGAEKRFSIPFEDPKIADGTPEQASKYEERSLQIATEMKFIFSQIKQK